MEDEVYEEYVYTKDDWEKYSGDDTPIPKIKLEAYDEAVIIWFKNE